VSILFGYLPHAAGLNEWACIFIGSLFIVAVVRFFFKVVPDDPKEGQVIPSPFWEKFVGIGFDQYGSDQNENKVALLSSN